MGRFRKVFLSLQRLLGRNEITGCGWAVFYYGPGLTFFNFRLIFLIGMISKRKFRRISIIGLAHVLHEQSYYSVPACIANINQGGLGIYTTGSMTGSIETRLNFSNETGEWLDVKIKGQVVWSRKIGPWHALGIQFDALDPASHKMTVSFLDQIGEML